MTREQSPGAPIGVSEPRWMTRRLLAGRGRYLDDVPTGPIGHVVFVRSPHAHARIRAIDTEAALASPGVIAVVAGAELAEHHTPWVGTITNLPPMKSPPQHALAIDLVRFQGEPVVAVVADSRALAEDAAELVEIDYEPLEPVVDPQAALEPGAVVITPDLGDNQLFEMAIPNGDVDAALADAETVVEATLTVNRQTLVSLEPRGLVARYDPAEQVLDIQQSTQVPNIMRYLFAKHLGLEEHRVRVAAPDVGGAFGIKIHTYQDEMATAVLAKMLARPVKFVADRLESFISDVHCRDHRISARIGLDADGKILGLAVDDLASIGPYSVYPRSSAIESLLVVLFSGAPYHLPTYRGSARTAFQTKNVVCQLRGVGMPLACSIGEAILDKAARAAGLDPLDVRRRNLIKDDSYPYQTASGMPFETLSQERALEKLVEMMGYDALRADQAEKRKEGIYRGIGLSFFIEGTSPGPAVYGEGGAPISAQDATTIRLEPNGGVTVASGASEQGQGLEAVLTQITAAGLGIDSNQVRVLTGDTDKTPYGGGTWASRATAIAGEATLRAARTLKHNILMVAGSLLQADAASLDIRAGVIVDATSGTQRMKLTDLGHICHFRQSELEPNLHPSIVVTEPWSVRSRMFLYTNGCMAMHVEVDVETGFTKVLKGWVVEDCGRVINPMLLDGQIRGGVVQGIGNALYEELVYDEAGQLRNGSLIDYLVPMAGEMPDIEVAHIESPTEESTLGAKGAGEAGVIGAPAAIQNAINDALSPFGVELFEQPFTPRRILEALGKC